MQLLRVFRLFVVATVLRPVAARLVPHPFSKSSSTEVGLHQSDTGLPVSLSRPPTHLIRRYDFGASAAYHPQLPPVALAPTWKVVLGLYAPVFLYCATQTLAAATILDFYLNLLDLVITVWSEQEPLNQIVIRYGIIRLEIGCSTEPVPWEFIENFAISEAEAVRRGFTMGWDKQYWHHKKDTSRTCYVALAFGFGFAKVDDDAPP